MKTIVVYRSKTGFTERYAKWIASELGCMAIDFKDFNLDKIGSYDLIVYGGRLYAGKIDGFHKLQQSMKKYDKTKLVVFAVGVTSLKNDAGIAKIWKDNFIGMDSDEVPHFYMPGGLDYDRMGRMDRLIMRAVAKSTAKKLSESGSDGSNELDLQHSVDATSREYMEPLLRWIRQ